MTVAVLDEVILSLCSAHWLKVARVIADADRDPRLSQIDVEDRMDAVATRITALVNASKLEAVGHLEQWRFSEIRLAGAST
ncbi:hypothetical protein DBR42_00370 [Pelomonas sp. HMWF004]|nr:hypothetical protein DBR42_00370 [Pelomonas sp. HMWF004]